MDRPSAIDPVNPPRLADRPDRRNPCRLQRHPRTAPGARRTCPWQRHQRWPQHRPAADEPGRVGRPTHPSARQTQPAGARNRQRPAEPRLHRRRPESGLGDRLRAPRGVREPWRWWEAIAGCLSQQAFGSWRTVDCLGVGVVGGAVLDDDEPFQDCQMGRARLARRKAYARNQRLKAPQDETTDSKPGGHGLGGTAHPPAEVGGELPG